MNNRKQEICFIACIVIWFLIIGVLFVLVNVVGLVQGIEFLDELGLGMGAGIVQSVALIGLYLKYNDENNPIDIDDEYGPPDTWIVRIGFFKWMRGKLVDKVEIDSPTGIGVLYSPLRSSRFGSNNYFKVQKFSKYAGLYEVLRG